MPPAGMNRGAEPTGAYRPTPDRRKVRHIDPARLENAMADTPRPPLPHPLSLPGGTARPCSRTQAKIDTLEAHVQQLEQQLKAAELERVNEQARHNAQPWSEGAIICKLIVLQMNMSAWLWVTDRALRLLLLDMLHLPTLQVRSGADAFPDPNPAPTWS